MKKLKGMGEVEMAFGHLRETFIPKNSRRAEHICNRHKWCNASLTACPLYNFCRDYIKYSARPKFNDIETTKAILKAQINEKEFKLI